MKSLAHLALMAAQILGGLFIATLAVEVSQTQRPKKPVSRTSESYQDKSQLVAPEEKVKPLIVMIKCRLGDEDSFGAGIIFSFGNDRIYIMTANHVVRKGTQEAQNLRVQFKWLPGQSIEARLLEHSDSNLDLAVLAVVGSQGMDFKSMPFNQLGDTNSLKRGDSVYSIGNPRGQPWRVNVTPDKVSSKSSNLINFDSGFIGPGHSGGALLNEMWELVGMIKADQPPDGVAVNIQNVLDTLSQWGYQVNLKRESDSIPLVGKALFLDVSQGQDQWNGLTEWAMGSSLQINLLREPFGHWSFSGEAPGVIIFPLPYRHTLDDKKAIAIKNWVERGGGLLILGYYAADSHHGSNVSRLTREWGITINDDLVMPQGASPEDTRLQAFGSEEALGVILETKGSNHPLIFGINRVVLLSAASLDVRYAKPRDFELKTSPTSEIWRPDGPKDPKGMRPIIVRWDKSGQESAVVFTSFRYGRGKVAVIGTWKVVTLPYGDNKRFIENVIDWIRP